jgi:bifunctional UDP-N-acetylglucosamine pyrophosphorylase / glucosamine-1-phosphate N-acetyltransferase
VSGGGLGILIPAAGRGTRLGLDVPKILAPIGEEETTWSLLFARLRGFGHVHVVLSPVGHGLFERVAAEEIASGQVSTSVQPKPSGMGDAIFGAEPHWRRFDDLLILWGDQLGISEGTLARTVAEHLGGEGTCLTLPVTWRPRPYVQYRFSPEGALVAISQSREGDACEPEGFSDVGLFGLSTQALLSAWVAFARGHALGRETREANFLPFLVYLSATCGWPVRRVVVQDPGEARGLNTPEDFAFFRERLRAQRSTGHG